MHSKKTTLVIFYTKTHEQMMQSAKRIVEETKEAFWKSVEELSKL